MDYLVSDTDLTSVADAIRAKGGTSAQLEFPNGFNTAIANIPSGGGGGSTERYEIKISLTNPQGSYNFNTCQIYTFSSQFDPDNPDGPFYNTTRLVNVYNADESFDIYVPTDIWGIWILLAGGSPDGAEYGTCSVTGSLTVDTRYPWGYEGWVILVSGNGIVTIDGADYDP